MVSTRHPDIEPTHPGEMLREIVIPGTGRSKAEIARLLGVSRQTLYDVLGCKQPVTATMAARLGKLFGNGPGLWLRMQAEHDIWHAERVDLPDIAPLTDAPAEDTHDAVARIRRDVHRLMHSDDGVVVAKAATVFEVKRRRRVPGATPAERSTKLDA